VTYRAALPTRVGKSDIVAAPNFGQVECETFDWAGASNFGGVNRLAGCAWLVDENAFAVRIDEPRELGAVCDPGFHLAAPLSEGFGGWEQFNHEGWAEAWETS